MREFRRRHLAVGAATAVILLAGCGGGGGSTSSEADQAGALAAVNQLRDAQLNGDSEAACGLVDGDLSVKSSATGNSAKVPCERLVTGGSVPVVQDGASVVSISGDAAEVKDVTLSGSSMLIQLSNGPDGWRITGMKVP